MSTSVQGSKQAARALCVIENGMVCLRTMKLKVKENLVIHNACRVGIVARCIHLHHYCRIAKE